MARAGATRDQRRVERITGGGASGASDEVQALREQLLRAQDLIAELEEALKGLIKPSRSLAYVVSVKGDDVVLSTGPASFSLVGPPKDEDLREHVVPGAIVFVQRDSGQIVALADDLIPETAGAIAEVQRVEDGRIYVGGDDPESERAVLPSPLLARTPEVGERVVTDPSGCVARTILPPRKRQTSVERSGPVETGVSWDDVGGQEEAKQALRDAIELPLLRPDLFEKYGRRRVKGVLLYGPPGCGKTLLAKAVATAVARAGAGGADAGLGGFLYVKGPELLNSYVGVTEGRVRAIFAQAREYERATGQPLVVFIDEADAILGRRGARTSFMEHTVVPQFLAEMDGIEASGALVLLSTNRPDQLDSAIVREGRIDRKVLVQRPGPAEAEAIFDIHLRRVPLAPGVIRERLARAATDALFAQHARNFAELTLEGGEVVRFGLRHIASGALIAGVVDVAASGALHRELRGDAGPDGVGLDDVVAALDAVHRANRSVDLGEPLADLLGGRRVVRALEARDASAA